MPRSTPTTLALPPFAGATRILVLISVAVFFAEALMHWVLSQGLFTLVFGHLALYPVELVHGFVWQLVTYAFVPLGLYNTLFTLLFLWFIGAMLEEARGGRWLYEIFFTSVVGGALLASAISFTHVFNLSELHGGFGPYSGIYGLMIAILVMMGEVEFNLFFVLRLKAKYMVILYLVFDTARLLLHAEPFDALLNLSGALCGYLFLRFVPRRGLLFGATERYYSMRNDYYRSKRRRAAKKFEVYMSKQGRDDVHFDKDGRYVDPDKDPTDKRWMN